MFSHTSKENKYTMKKNQKSYSHLNMMS